MVASLSKGRILFYVFGKQRLKILKIISFLKTRKLISKGYSTYLAYTVDISKEGKKTVNDVPVVNEYPDVFPDYFPGFPSDSQIKL